MPPKTPVLKLVKPTRTLAPVAVAIIAKDSAKTIGACLDSIVPYVKQVVVCIDANTKDDTARVAKRHGAKVYYGLNVSEPHECPQHGKVMAQHFARARDASFSKLDPEIPWRMWIDADDIVKGADRLCEYLAAIPEHVSGIWLPYHYSTAGDEGIATTTLFDRERLVRTADNWHWMHRVHEVLVPDGRPIEHVPMTRTDDVSIWHQGKGHDTAGSAKRNILCLEIELEEKPGDSRSLFYLGNQYFALSNWVEAVYWYRQSMSHSNHYQLWQTLIYTSMAYEKLGDLRLSAQAAHEAIEVAPYHPEPYYRLAQVAMLRGDTQRCEFWTNLGDQCPDPPFFAFRNPLDRTYNARVTLGNAYFHDGQISKAKKEFQRANSVVNSDTLRKGIDEFTQLERDSLTADAFAVVIQSLNGSTTELSVPENVWKFGRIRDLAVPKMLAARPNTQPRIVFWCGQPVEPWAPPVLDTTGIGGSETAVIEIGKRFARDGYRVDVYNNPDKFEGVHEEVGYWGLNRLQPGEHAEILVGWRNAASSGLPLNRALSVLWCHDLNRGPDEGAHLGSWGLVLGVSNWHRDYLSQVYGVQKEKVSWVPNGINLERFSQPVRKIPFRCVYASSPDRGLARLLRMWPAIIAKEPTAELHIAYGWDVIDRMIAGGVHDLVAVKAEVMDLLNKSKNVHWLGRLPQKDLAKLYQESYVWLYPTSFLEVSCISAMEAMAAGCVPVTSAAGALPETISDCGVVVTGNTYTKAWQEFYLHCAVGAMTSPAVRKPLAAKGPERVQELTWDKAYERWKEVVVSKLECAKEMVSA